MSNITATTANAAMDARRRVMATLHFVEGESDPSWLASRSLLPPPSEPLASSDEYFVPYLYRYTV